MQNVIIRALLACAIMPSLSIQAEQYTVTAEQITHELQARYPLTRSYEGVEAEFSKPRVIIKNLDNEIEIKVKITLSHQGQSLLADGRIVDVPTIHAVTNTLRFEHPKLDEFFVSLNNMKNSEEAIKVMKQTIGQTLPPIVLLDLEKIDLNIVGNVPLKFSLSPQGLVLEY